MKLLIVAIFLLGLVVSQSSEESVLHMLADLKKNAELELEGLEMAWERRLKVHIVVNGIRLNKTWLIKSMGVWWIRGQNATIRNQMWSRSWRIWTTQSDISSGCWWDNPQTSSELTSWRPIGIPYKLYLRCAQTNNYVNDIRNRKVALQLIKFLRDQLGRLGSEASLA